jgi:hypothetical protein
MLYSKCKKSETYIPIQNVDEDKNELIEFNQSYNINEQREVLSWLMKKLQTKNTSFEKISSIKSMTRRLKLGKYYWTFKLNFYNFTNSYDAEIEEAIPDPNKPPIQTKYSLIKFEPIIRKRRIGTLEVKEDNALYNGNFNTIKDKVYDYRKVAKFSEHKLEPL